MSNFKLDISYDGNNFFGWQIQKKGRTVQGEISLALEKVFNEKKINLIGAGRTDSGVHANQQIANIKIDTYLKPISIKNAINANIKNDVYINSCEIVDETFNSRFDASSRDYIYIISNHFNPIKRNNVWHVDGLSFKVDLLNEIAKCLIGKNDFSTFCKQNSLRENNQCDIFYSKWSVDKKQLYFSIKGNRFLHHMVRYLVGTMISVVTGKLDLKTFKDLFYNKQISNLVIKAPAHGLYLNKIYYE